MLPFLTKKFIFIENKTSDSFLPQPSVLFKSVFLQLKKTNMIFFDKIDGKF